MIVKRAERSRETFVKNIQMALPVSAQIGEAPKFSTATKVLILHSQLFSAACFDKWKLVERQNFRDQRCLTIKKLILQVGVCLANQHVALRVKSSIDFWRSGKMSSHLSIKLKDQLYIFRHATELVR